MIRSAEDADLDALVELETTGLGVDAWGAPVLRDELGAGRILLVADDDRVTGYVDVSVAGDVADLLRIVVDPAARRTGTATVLLDAASRRAADLGAARMLLEVSTANTAALSFYEHAGFTSVSRRRRYYRDGSDALVLQRSLVEEA